MSKSVMVAGAWDEERPETLDVARRVGSFLAQLGCIVVTGGGTGLPSAALQGAADAGGTSVAVIGQDRQLDPDHELNSVATVRIYTGSGWDGRSVVAVKSSDVVVAIGGSNGTLNELTLAYLNGIPSVLLRGSSETLSHVAVLAAGGYLDQRKTAPVVVAEDEDDLLRRLRDLL